MPPIAIKTNEDVDLKTLFFIMKSYITRSHVLHNWKSCILFFMAEK